MHSSVSVGTKSETARASLRRVVGGFGLAILLGTSVIAAAPCALAQAGNHSLVWTTGDIIHIDPASPFSGTRWGSGGNPLLGTAAQPYNDVSAAVNDMLWDPNAAPVFPVVFNVRDNGTAVTSYSVSNLRLPAHGVKLQTLSNAEIALDGGMTSSPVLVVDTEGPRFYSGGTMPASIIQGFTIRNGGTGVELRVASVTSDKPIKTEVRDCVITENKFQQVFPNPTPPGGVAGGGTGIRIISNTSAPTQYVIENNEISRHGDFFFGDIGPSSRGIYITVYPTREDSTLIRGNRMYEQETGIQIQATSQSWARPRVLSNFLWEQEQHVFSQEGGAALFNNTIYRARDFCMGPDRHVVHHQATPVAADVDPRAERAAMIVRNCIIEHDEINTPAVEPGGTPAFPPTWDVDSFCGGGSVFLSNSDIEAVIGVAPSNFPGTPGAVACSVTPLGTRLVMLSGNFQARMQGFVSPTTPSPDLHLLSTALQAESGDAKDIEPGIAMILVGQSWLPCDVRTDVDGHVRLVDLNRDGKLVPDRGGDEACTPPQFGMTLEALNVDRTGNLPAGATVTFLLRGMPNDVALVQGWLDCPTDSNDDVVFNNQVFLPLGNLLVPQCGAVNSPLIVLDAAGIGVFSLPLAGLPETQVYFQAIGLTLGSNPGLGTASNRVRVELN
jgi:hypothetical protein